jgi:membrane protein
MNTGGSRAADGERRVPRALAYSFPFTAAALRLRALFARRRTEDARARETEGTKDEERSWKALAFAFKDEVVENNLSLTAAGVAFYSFLSVFPALAASVSIYGLISDPIAVERQVAAMSGVVPERALSLMLEQMSAVTNASDAALSLATVGAIFFLLWSVTQGIDSMMVALNIAYRNQETRGFVRRKARSLAMALGVIVFGLIAISALIVLPAVLAFLPLPAETATLIGAARWPILVVAIVIGLVGLYRYAPNHERRPRLWPGAWTAALLWAAGSALLSLYVTNFGNYNETYGSLAAVVVMMLWLYFSALVTLLGGALNAILANRHRA